MFIGFETASTSTPFFDKFGRPNDPRLRDTNPGLFHLVLTNSVGRDAPQARKIIVDVDWTERILNLSVASYRTTSEKLGVEAAARRYPEFFAPDVEGAQSYRFAPAGTSLADLEFYDVTTNVTFVDTHRILERSPDLDRRASIPITYTYLLEVDRKSGNIIGGEWVKRSSKVHPDFLMSFTETQADFEREANEKGLFLVRFPKLDLKDLVTPILNLVAASVQDGEVSPEAGRQWEAARSHAEMKIGFDLLSFYSVGDPTPSP